MSKEDKINQSQITCSPCTCLTKQSTASEEEEEADDEIDPDELLTDTRESQIWKKICHESDLERQPIIDYRLSLKDLKIPPNPPIDFLEKEIFPHMVTILEETVFQAQENDCIKYQKSVFNAIDVISEMLWNLNPRYPERKLNWSFRFDMQWVKDWLEQQPLTLIASPRPYFPLSWIWSREYAATKLQAVVKGYWVRREPEVQEMRQFWIEYKKDKREKITEEEQRILSEQLKARAIEIYEEMQRRRCMPKIGLSDS